jgi:hypothetical protein
MLSCEMVFERPGGTMLYHARGTSAHLRMDDDVSSVMRMRGSEMGWFF